MPDFYPLFLAARALNMTVPDLAYLVWTLGQTWWLQTGILVHNAETRAAAKRAQKAWAKARMPKG